MSNKKKKSKKKVAIIVSCSCVGTAALITGWIAFCGYQWTWGPFSKLANSRFAKLEGNSSQYALENVEELPPSPLKGKDILYLGSSVTYGASSLQTAFPEYIAKRNGTTFCKEAVSGTALVDGMNSYIRRLKKVDKSRSFDLFVCQLSTNDATQKKPLGEVTGSEASSYNASTVCGAIETIISYVTDTWNCPIVFYTNPYYESKPYADMVDALDKIQQKHGIGVIDFYRDVEFNNITEEERSLYMADRIHPTRAGYLKWWTPKMEAYLYDFVGKSR